MRTANFNVDKFAGSSEVVARKEAREASQNKGRRQCGPERRHILIPEPVNVFDYVVGVADGVNFLIS